jgi:hypothetical protein
MTISLCCAQPCVRLLHLSTSVRSFVNLFTRLQVVAFVNPKSGSAQGIKLLHQLSDVRPALRVRFLMRTVDGIVASDASVANVGMQVMQVLQALECKWASVASYRWRSAQSC